MTDDEVERAHYRGGVFLSWPIAATLLLVIVFGFVVLGWRLTTVTQDYTNKIASTALRVSCESGNDFRRLDKERFDGIVGLFGPGPHRPDTQFAIDTINARTKKADVQRDCDKPQRSVPSTVPTSTTTTTRKP